MYTITGGARGGQGAAEGAVGWCVPSVPPGPANLHHPRFFAERFLLLDFVDRANT